DANCTVLFTHELCAMQDLISRMLIGAGEQRDGLYMYRGVRKFTACQTQEKSSIDLWHKRMGHPSYK
ncbi:hypothetical protein HN51_038806, partial [Arachis hypogaea]